MKIRVNGATRETSAATIEDLLTELALPPQTVLVERNTQALRRDDWATTALHEGDTIEILRVAAGG